jgi:hypothetical protein
MFTGGKKGTSRVLEEATARKGRAEAAIDGREAAAEEDSRSPGLHRRAAMVNSRRRSPARATRQ